MASSNSNPFDGAPIIHTYTRAEAIADGVLVDATSTAAEAGFKHPVALTRAVWEDCVAWDERDSRRQTMQDESGRLWDVVWMARVGIGRARAGGSVLLYTLYRIPRGGRGVRPRLVALKLVCGPGDEGEPVITIMQPEED